MGTGAPDTSSSTIPDTNLVSAHIKNRHQHRVDHLATLEPPPCGQKRGWREAGEETTHSVCKIFIPTLFAIASVVDSRISQSPSA